MSDDDEPTPIGRPQPVRIWLQPTRDERRWDWTLAQWFPAKEIYSERSGTEKTLYAAALAAAKLLKGNK